MGCDTVGMELRNPAVHIMNTPCLANLEHDCMYHILTTASHTKKLQCRRGIPRTYGQTGRRAAFLSSRLRAPDAGRVVTLLICWQPAASNSVRIFCLFRILSFIISFFPVVYPSLVPSTFFGSFFPFTFPSVSV